MEPHDVAHHGVISTAELRELGIGPALLRQRVRAGSLLPLVRGWYAAAPPDEPPPWEAEDQFERERNLHRLRTAALLRSFEGRVVASHGSALILHGVPLWRSDVATVHLARTLDDHSRHRKGAVIHPAVGAAPVQSPSGLLTVPVSFAVVQAGLVALAHGDDPDAMESLVAADGALRAELVTDAQLTTAVKRHEHHPHIDAVRRLLGHADGRHESVGETRLGHALRLLGWVVTPQPRLHTKGRSYRADFGLDGEKVLIEFDGLEKYLIGPADQPPKERARLAVAAQRRRQEDLEEIGYEFARVSWQDLDRPASIDAKVRAARDRARLRRSA